jgi:exopolysaccharide production protein ExoY
MNTCSVLVAAEPAASIRAVPLPWWKRSLDILVVIASLPIVLPIAVAIAALIKSTSAGPLFFKQSRVGYRGRQFLLYKFRTMTVNADTSGHQQYLKQLMGSNAPMAKLDNRGDSRLIRCGWILRSTGLDELPQLLNVLKGEMSIVGPRPCIPYEYENYTEQQKERFAACPGLTGLWQVSGKNRTTFDEMIRLDVTYSETKSFWLDLVIIFRTPTALFQQVTEARLSRRRAPAAEEVFSKVVTPRVARTHGARLAFANVRNVKQ